MLIFREISCAALPAEADALLSLWQEPEPLPLTDRDSAVVFYEDDVLTGISVIREAFTETKPRCAVVSRLVIAPAARRHGLGRMLMGQTAGAVLSHGAYFLAAPIPDTDEARAFAKSVGMKETALFSDMLMLDLTDVEGLRHGKPKPHA